MKVRLKKKLMVSNVRDESIIGSLTNMEDARGWGQHKFIIKAYNIIIIFKQMNLPRAGRGEYLNSTCLSREAIDHIYYKVFFLLLLFLISYYKLSSERPR